jgi:GntR family transcriptional regulator, transcriptional repressor for pyruvate dehydrogenase complex
MPQLPAQKTRTLPTTKRRPLRPIGRPDMVDEVLRRLSEQIMTGAFDAQGLLPPEGALAESFGVSRTVIREAMRTLRAQGLVEVSQGKLPRVKPADAEAAIASLGLLLRRSDGTLLHLIEARRPLESEIALLAAERARPEDIVKLQETIDQLSSAATLDERIEADVRFHRILAESAGNPVFCLMLETIAGLLYESRRQTIAQSGIEVAAEGHRAVLDAVRRHDGAAAKDAMLDHLRLAERDLRAAEKTKVSKRRL